MTDRSEQRFFPIFEIKSDWLKGFNFKGGKIYLIVYSLSKQVDERLTVPHGTVNVHRHHHGMPLSITNSSLHFPLATMQLYPNQTVDITCLSTIPSYASKDEGFADVQNLTVTGK